MRDLGALDKMVDIVLAYKPKKKKRKKVKKAAKSA
jgi:hypothetical protein